MEGTEERRKKMDNEAREEESRSGKEKGRRERRERLVLKEGVSTLFSNDAF